MKTELRYFFTAILFYTRIPCPSWVGHEPEYLNKATRYLPLVGWIVGGLSALGYLLLSKILPVELSIIGSMIVSVWVTGGFHEDGLADVCDGFGGGWTREKILDIMKDSRVGTFGVLGLIFVLFAKYHALFALHTFSSFQFFLLIVASHSISRMMAVTILYTESYAREDARSKVKPIAKKISFLELLVALLFALIPVLAFIVIHPLGLGLLPVLWAFGLMVPLRFYLVRLFNRWLGGYTGDCLGAAQQIAEVLFLIGIISYGHLFSASS